MALVVVKEDGSGRADANSYAAVAEADAFFEGHLYASAWTGATAGNKSAALVMATRLIDSQFQFNGSRTNEGQALQWPRAGCLDPDRRSADWGMVRAGLAMSAEWVPEDAVRGAEQLLL